MQDLSQGLLIALIGYVMVFVVLCFLWGILVLMKQILAPKKEQAVEKAKPAPVENKQIVETKDVDDDELVAVLTAAVASSLNTSTYNLRIKSYKRINTVNNAWSNASRIDAVNKF